LQIVIMASIFAILVSATVKAVITIVEEKEPQKQTATIDKEELAWIFEIGYLKGRVNEIKCETFEESKLRWQKDSAEIVGIYFKKEIK